MQQLIAELREAVEEEGLVLPGWDYQFDQGCNSIDILDGLNPRLNPCLNRRPIWRLPKRVLNPCLNLRLNSSL